jgi:hypothetical protein
MKALLAIVLAYLTVVFPRASISAQIRHTAGIHTPHRSIPGVLPQAAFDATTDRLPASFRGNDAGAIYAALASSKVLAPKSEFETTSAYNERIASFAHVNYSSGLSAGSLLSFVLEPNPLKALSLEETYDADKGDYVIRFRLDRATLGDDDSPVLLNLFSVKKHSDEYVGANAFGAEATVTKWVEDEYDVDVASSGWLQNETLGDKYSVLSQEIHVPMPPNEAFKRNGSLRLLFIGRVETPWFKQTIDGSTATLDSPVERITTHKILAFHVITVWIFDVRTGEILKRIKDSGYDSPDSSTTDESVPGPMSLPTLTMPGMQRHQY